MSSLPSHFRLLSEPVAADDATITTDSVRFSVLTDGLVRLEYHPEGKFVDQPSQTMWFRKQPIPVFKSNVSDERIEIETDRFHLKYYPKLHAGFTPENLIIDVKPADTKWFPGKIDTENLHGTTRTLDYTNGYAELEPGLLSRAGWSVIDDSDTLIFANDEWLEVRPAGGTDLYFFAYGTDYKACLQDYCAVSGHVPMIPRYILGNWWSRYWAYTQDELLTLLDDFDNYDLPFSVCIIDMDWHVTKTNNDSTGWTGYTWNRDLFPDPEALIAETHERGLKVALNLHPAEGIHRHEEAYEEMAKIMGIDPASGEPVPFDITDPAFTTAYLSVLHHPYEAMGVDFWWLDWQQGLNSKLPGLDPLWLINHVHFADMGRNGTNRPFIFSRWGRQGHQRYPIGFSGDSYATWDSLNFQPYMTATASNIAYGWWSHDIGGHVSGSEDPELYARWTQFGALSPINRIHATKGLFYDRRPWFFEDAEILRVLRDALQLRHALIPYIYTQAFRAHTDCLPLVQPMYYDHPNSDEAYYCPQQYMFGTELLAAPFVTTGNNSTGLSRQVVWLPEGEWYHVFSGEYYAGARWQPIHGTLAEIPLFARAGAIVPLAADPLADAVSNPVAMDVLIFAGADHEFTLYEDDGLSTGYREDHAVRTTFAQSFQDSELHFTIEQPTGSSDLLPAERTYQLTIRGVKANVHVDATISGQPTDVTTVYEVATETLTVMGITLTPADSLDVRITANDGIILARRNRKRENLLRLLKFFRLNTSVRNAIASELDVLIEDPERLNRYTLLLSQEQLQALAELLFDAGLHVVKETIAPNLIVLWNNTEASDISFRYNEAYLWFGQIPTLKSDDGPLPQYRAIIPEVKSWSHGSLDQHVHQTQWRVQIDYGNVATVYAEHREESP